MAKVYDNYIVRMAKRFRNLNAGETAGFPQHVAAHIVKDQGGEVIARQVDVDNRGRPVLEPVKSFDPEPVLASVKRDDSGRPSEKEALRTLRIQNAVRLASNNLAAKPTPDFTSKFIGEDIRLSQAEVDAAWVALHEREATA